MTATTVPMPVASESRELKVPGDNPVFPRSFIWSVERYHAAIEIGLLTENDPVELIYGQLSEKMPIGKRHSDCVDDLGAYFAAKYQKTYRLRAQNPITIGEFSEPEPDFAIVNRETYANREGNPIPEDILLLIEVSNATLKYDRGIKAAMYAQAGIAEYWIINLQTNHLERYLQPSTELGEYGSVQHFTRDTTFESPFCGEVTVADLIPAAEADTPR